MPKEIIHVPGLSESLAAAGVPLSFAVRANGFIFVSGMPPLDPKTAKPILGDIREQTKCCLDNLKLVLDAAGATLDDVVKVNVFIANSAYFDIVNTIYKDYFPSNPPARTFATVGSWPWPFDIEIECIAISG